MIIIQIEKFEFLLNESESPYLDWKEDFSKGLLLTKEEKKNPENKRLWEIDRAKLIKDLVAIANSIDEQKGYLVLGVKDNLINREVTGISKPEQWDDAIFQEWVKKYVFPLINFSFEELDYSGTTVGLFEISPSTEFPHLIIENHKGIFYKGQIYYRHGSQNRIALYSELKEMFGGIEPYKIDGLESPIMKEAINYYESKGYHIFVAAFNNKDTKLHQGYQIGYYPGTRKEIWCMRYDGQPDCILMVKSSVKGATK